MCVCCYTVTLLFYVRVVCSSVCAVCGRRGGFAGGGVWIVGWGLGCQPTVAGMPDEWCPLGCGAGWGWVGVCSFSLRSCGLSCVYLCVYVFILYTIYTCLYIVLYVCVCCYTVAFIFYVCVVRGGVCAVRGRLGGLAGIGAVLVCRWVGLSVENAALISGPLIVLCSIELGACLNDSGM